ncbi:beta-phosphoglucomutase family hydrolase [Thermithiobacillus plumbiphilus]|uniref:Beta-phosphoglucomutase family hydrolase n=1 Tax=Thermithiobacillus plumbiphilus TaxID=1729899 RepID=A0ABU9DC02_9PROT
MDAGKVSNATIPNPGYSAWLRQRLRETMMNTALTLSRSAFDALIFDLDGVITRSASVHAQAWKAMFDAFLQQWTAARGIPFQPFDIDTDYRLYVDGKPRHDGVRSFIAARGIDLPEGNPDDPAEIDSVMGLGKRKDRLFLKTLAEQGVERFDSSIHLIEQARGLGFKTAVVTASKNCAATLRAAGLSGLFDATVDGNVAGQLHLQGKPAPDTFLEAVRRLGIRPARAAGFEDAIAGVQAIRAAGYGCVIGVDRHGQPETLKAAGADRVVADLAEVFLIP